MGREAPSLAETAPFVRHRSRREGASSLGVAACAVPEPHWRSLASEILQEQSGLLPNPRLRYILQQCTAAPGNVLVLGEAAGGSSCDDSSPRGRVDLVGGLGRSVHRHGIQTPTGSIQKPQLCRPRLGPPDLRSEKLDGAQRRRVSDQKLPVVHGLHGRVGQHGPTNPKLREVGPGPQIDDSRQAVPRVGRSDGPGLSTVQGEREMGGQDLFRRGVLLRRVLGGDCGNF